MNREQIEDNKKNFILHNIVRLREMIRYLPSEKLNLFKMIPFLIHINSPDFPGYVKLPDIKSTTQKEIISKDISSSLIKFYDNIFGVWNFENSGFAKDIAEKNPIAKELLSKKNDTPAVQALYHIGSLGTFTQSAKSDFDFWVVIEKPDFKNKDDELHYKDFINILHEKLALITTYSRKEFSQEVTFFVHYAHNLRDNVFDNPDDEDSVAVPELLLKEEFYRTFIMVAGKIPLWAVQPFGLDQEELEQWKKEVLNCDGFDSFIDLGTFDSMPIEEIQRGLLWQICKAPYDPVKSVIKASITASYNVKKERLSQNITQQDKGDRPSPILLCDMVKERFGHSIIDDYAADPYIIAFERIIEFYAKNYDERGLSQIKAAIFFRLCGFPQVTLPPKDSPKRKILDRYIRQWQLGSKRLKKLLEYQSWSESEKTLFDRTMIERLYTLYKSSVEQELPDKQTDNQKITQKNSREITQKKNNQIASDLTLPKKESDLIILKNKVNKITLKKKGVLPVCSTYLRLKPQTNMILIAKEQNDSSSSNNAVSYEWILCSVVEKSQIQADQSDKSNKSYKLLYSSKYFMETVGWSMYNHIYIRGTTHLKMKVPFKLYASFEKPSDCDDIYLALQPWLPLSDEPFLSKPFWEKVVVMLFVQSKDEPSKDNGKDAIDSLTQEINNHMFQKFNRAEFLARNSWGEIFFDALNLEHVENPEERCYQTAMKIFDYHEAASNYSIFIMASKPVPKLIQKIKTIVEDTKILKNSSNTTIIKRRPYLDTI